MKRKFAIGDIHGCRLTFRKLMFDKLQITKYDEVYLLGDLIDRGPRIRELIDDVISLQDKGYNIISVKGNHEWMLLKSIKNQKIFDLWVLNNAMTTLHSFNVNYAAHIPPKYLNFFKNMPYYIELENFIIVHGGLNFGKKNPMKHKKAMVWTRNGKISKKELEKIGNKRLIVGHTPVDLQTALASNKTNKIMLDGGCVYKNKFPDVGYLIAYDIDNDKFYYEENIDF